MFRRNAVTAAELVFAEWQRGLCNRATRHPCFDPSPALLRRDRSVVEAKSVFVREATLLFV